MASVQKVMRKFSVLIEQIRRQKCAAMLDALDALFDLLLSLIETAAEERGSQKGLEHGLAAVLGGFKFAVSVPSCGIHVNAASDRPTFCLSLDGAARLVTAMKGNGISEAERIGDKVLAQYARGCSDPDLAREFGLLTMPDEHSAEGFAEALERFSYRDALQQMPEPKRRALLEREWPKLKPEPPNAFTEIFSRDAIEIADYPRRRQSDSRQPSWFPPGDATAAHDLAVDYGRMTIAVVVSGNGEKIYPVYRVAERVRVLAVTLSRPGYVAAYKTAENMGRAHAPGLKGAGWRIFEVAAHESGGYVVMSSSLDVIIEPGLLFTEIFSRDAIEPAEPLYIHLDVEPAPRIPDGAAVKGGDYNPNVSEWLTTAAPQTMIGVNAARVDFIAERLHECGYEVAALPCGFHVFCGATSYCITYEKGRELALASIESGYRLPQSDMVMRRATREINTGNPATLLEDLRRPCSESGLLLDDPHDDSDRREAREVLQPVTNAVGYGGKMIDAVIRDMLRQLGFRDCFRYRHVAGFLMLDVNGYGLRLPAAALLIVHMTAAGATASDMKGLPIALYAESGGTCDPVAVGESAPLPLDDEFDSSTAEMKWTNTTGAPLPLTEAEQNAAAIELAQQTMARLTQAGFAPEINPDGDLHLRHCGVLIVLEPYRAAHLAQYLERDKLSAADVPLTVLRQYERAEE